jgi:hypothetical protein
MSLQSDIAIQILRAASQTPLGVRVKITAISPDVIMPPLRAKGLLYAAKKINSEFANLTVRFDPIDPENYLWIHPMKPEDEIDL